MRARVDSAASAPVCLAHALSVAQGAAWPPRANAPPIRMTVRCTGLGALFSWCSQVLSETIAAVAIVCGATAGEAGEGVTWVRATPTHRAVTQVAGQRSARHQAGRWSPRETSPARNVGELTHFEGTLAHFRLSPVDRFHRLTAAFSS